MSELLVKKLHNLPGKLGEEIAVNLAAQPREAGGRDKARVSVNVSRLEREIQHGTEVSRLTFGSVHISASLFGLDRALLLQLPLKPSRTLVKLYKLLKGVVETISHVHGRTKCQVLQEPASGWLFVGRSSDPWFRCPSVLKFMPCHVSSADTAAVSPLQNATPGCRSHPLQTGIRKTGEK